MANRARTRLVLVGVGNLFFFAIVAIGYLHRVGGWSAAPRSEKEVLLAFLMVAFLYTLFVAAVNWLLVERLGHPREDAGFLPALILALAVSLSAWGEKARDLILAFTG